MVPLALVADCVTCIATLPWNALALSVSIELVFSSARVTSVKSQQGVGVRETRTHRLDPGIPGSDTKIHLGHFLGGSPKS